MLDVETFGKKESDECAQWDSAGIAFDWIRLTGLGF